MTRPRFWASAVLVTLAFALLTYLFLPYGWLGRETAELRLHAWQLTLWTGGAMCVLFGLAGLLGYRLPPGVREVYEAGSVRAALEARAARIRDGGGNFASWLVVTGLLLIIIYFVSWLVTR